MPDPAPLLCVDMGTTRTRTWLTHKGQILARASADFGVRNVAAGQSRHWLRSQLADLLGSTLLRSAPGSPSVMPAAIMAAGMISSDQGLAVVPHLSAPASLHDLAAHLYTEQIRLPSGLDLPLHFVPGVRTGSDQSSIEATLASDLMRGEETLCIGLLDSGQMQPGSTLLNLGSHWKWIWTDEHARVAHSWTTLTGEMIHTLQANTLLASSLPQHAPQALDPTWLAHGFFASANSGLSRALFNIRLLDLRRQGSPDQRLAFLYGAFLQNELSHLRHLPQPPHHLLLSGNACIAQAWAIYASRSNLSATILPESERELAYLHGLAALHRAQ